MVWGAECLALNTIGTRLKPTPLKSSTLKLQRSLRGCTAKGGLNTSEATERPGAFTAQGLGFGALS